MQQGQQTQQNQMFVDPVELQAEIIQAQQIIKKNQTILNMGNELYELRKKNEELQAELDKKAPATAPDEVDK